MSIPRKKPPSPILGGFFEITSTFLVAGHQRICLQLAGGNWPHVKRIGWCYGPHGAHGENRRVQSHDVHVMSTLAQELNTALQQDIIYSSLRIRRAGRAGANGVEES